MGLWWSLSQFGWLVLGNIILPFSFLSPPVGRKEKRLMTMIIFRYAASLYLVLVLVAPCCNYMASANIIFPVQSKFKGRGDLTALRAHDSRRHGRLLSSVNLDLPLGGNGNPADTGLYFAKIRIGTPPKDHHVQVDTGSDILWVNCAGCDTCPSKTDIGGVSLTQYDPNGSSSSSMVSCDQEFCKIAHHDPISGCKPKMSCQYNVEYGDGTIIAGYFVNDNLSLDEATGNLHLSPTNASVSFGCAVKQSGNDTSSAEALDGILGFGQANSSVLSQLASAGKVKKMFAHCLDGLNGGGIFAIGDVLQPKINTTKLVPNQSHYTVSINGIQVGDEVIKLPTSILDGLFGSSGGIGAIIDSGTTLAYLPDTIYDQLMDKISSAKSDLKLRTVENVFTCFDFSGNVDETFPVVKFKFDDSLTLAVNPHEYLFQISDDSWCIGWQSAVMQSKDGDDVALLGDLALSNKLVLYDIENQSIGWVEYNCSSSIKVKDESSGAVYTVGAHDLSSASTLVISETLQGIFYIFFITALLLHNADIIIMF